VFLVRFFVRRFTEDHFGPRAGILIRCAVATAAQLPQFIAIARGGRG
jgi:hypothetical protein